MSYSTLIKFYEEKLLPALFEQLDQAFPEFKWRRTACGWLATQMHDDGSPHPSHNVVCHQNWGFNDQQGMATSWLSHVHAGHESSAQELLEGIRRLAHLAGISDSHVPTTISTTEHEDFLRHERRTHLVETFLGYCQTYFDQKEGQLARERLATLYHIDYSGQGQLPIGYFSTVHNLANRLLAAGFSQQEIVDSHVLADSRLEDRFVIPWRDRWGRVSTILALGDYRSEFDTTQTLYLPGGSKTEAFGLDVALRPSSGGREHLVLVEGVLDVVYFQSLGVRNVATTGTDNHTISCEHWEKLAAHGIQAVTLAIVSSGPGLEPALVSVKHVDSALQAPQVFILSQDNFAQASSASDYVRRYDLEQFRDVLKNRVHGYRFIALNILRRHKTDTEWNDVSLRAALREAVEFDQAHGRPQRALELERYFWPTILESTGIRWDNLPKFLGQGSDESSDHNFTTRSYDLGLLLVDLERAIRAHDMNRFRSLILVAARRLDLTNADWQTNQGPISWETELGVPRPLSLDFEAASLADQPMASRDTQIDSPTPAEVKALAYVLWDRRGRPTGLDEQFWYEAEQTLRSGHQSFNSSTNYQLTV